MKKEVEFVDIKVFPDPKIDKNMFVVMKSLQGIFKILQCFR